MSERIEELRKAYDDAADSLADATAKYNYEYAAYNAYLNGVVNYNCNYQTFHDAAVAIDAADDAWRKAKAALEAAEREVRGE